MDVAATWEPIDSLTPHPQNPRHNDGAVSDVAASIRTFGFGAPLLVRTSDRVIIAGHTRWKAARSLGMDKVPVRFMDLDPARAAALMLADNKLGELATWDDELLATLAAEHDLDLTALGWSDEAADRLNGDGAETDRNRVHVERFEVLIPCEDEADQARRLDALLAENVPCTAITLQVAERRERPPAPENPIPPRALSFRRETRVTRTARVLQCAGLFDLQDAHSSAEEWAVDVDLPDAWNIGLVVGPSGSGKSTLASELFGTPDAVAWPETRAVVDGFPAGMSIMEITELLSSVGFSTPRAWLRPYHVLSTGQRFRVDVARVLAESAPVTVVDEFTSTVDRTVAQVGSAAIASAVRRRGQRFVAVTCHYDVADWLCPDWIIEMPSGTLTRRSLQRRPGIELEIRRVHHTAWDLFRAHHYLSADINTSAACYVAWWRGEPVSFAAVIPQMASRKWRAHRSVCLPDYQGIGIGHALQAYVAAMYATVGDFTMKISAPAVIAHALRSPDWVTIAPPSRYKAAGNKGTDSPRYGMSFRFAGEAKREAAGLFGVGPQAKPARKRRPRKGGGG